MTHEELSRKVEGLWHDSFKAPGYAALRAVVALHKPLYYRHGAIETKGAICAGCYEEESGNSDYPCPTIQAIEKELE